MIKKQILVFFLLAGSFRSALAQTDTIRLFYPIGDYSLSSHKNKLDSLLITGYELKELKIIGYADYLGSTAFNKVLSLKRAGTIKNYLKNTLKNTLIRIEGRGEISSGSKLTASGEPFNRRTDIIFNKSSIKSLNAVMILKTPVKADTVPAKPVDKPQPVVTADKAAEPENVYTRMDKLADLPVGESLSFKELTFQPGRHFLNRKAVPYLQTLLKILKKNPNLNIEIQGHICCDYENKDGYDFDTKEYKLSVNRAKFIYDYLMKKGIDAQRLLYRGFGNTKPKNFPELTEEDQLENRRVVIMITGK